jgi:uncharacterized protein (TIGR02271 family)
MTGDELRLKFLHVMQAILAWIEGMSTKIERAFSSGHSEREHIRTVPGSTAVSDGEQQHVIDLFGESIRVDKERVEQGELLIRKEVITETQMIAVPVTREELVIERRSKNGASSEVLRGQKIVRVPISEERVLIRKETVLNEQVSVRRRRIEEKKRVSVPVKHEEISVTRKDAA